MKKSRCCAADIGLEDGVFFCGVCGQVLEAPVKPLPEVTTGSVIDRLPAVDPTQPYTPADIEARILDATNRLERGLSTEARLTMEASDLKTEFELEYARALNAAQAGAADQRKARAMLAVEPLFRQLRTKESELAAMRGVLHSLRSALSGYQSVNRSVTASFNAGTPNR